MAAAVLSGNRNFEGRINPLVKANYLASPPLVVAYALAGTRRYRPGDRAAGHRQRRPAGLFEGHLADARGSDESGCRRDRRRDVPQAIRQRLSSRTRRGTPCPSRRASCIPWEAEEHLHPGAAVFDRLAARAEARSSRSAARGCWRPWAIRSRPTIFRPPARSPRPARPESIFWSMASSRQTSTATAPAAATTA